MSEITDDLINPPTHTHSHLPAIASRCYDPREQQDSMATASLVEPPT